MNDILNEFIQISKYFGFEQLNFLQLQGIDCVVAHEILMDKPSSLEDTLSKFPTESLLTIRTATISGNDFGLPSIIRCTKAQARDWIIKSQNPRYAFFVTPYFKSIYCGRMQISKNRIIIELVKGDFDLFTKGYIDIIIESAFGLSFKVIKNTTRADDDIIVFRLIALSKQLQEIYSAELDEKDGLTYDFDFTYGVFENQAGTVSEEFLKLICVRAFCLPEI